MVSNKFKSEGLGPEVSSLGTPFAYVDALVFTVLELGLGGGVESSRTGIFSRRRDRLSLEIFLISDEYSHARC